MRNVSSLGRKHEFGIGGEFNLPLSFAGICHRNPTDFRVVFSRDDNFLNRRQRPITAGKLGTVLFENYLIVIRLHPAWLKSGRPDLAAVDIAQEDV